MDLTLDEILAIILAKAEEVATKENWIEGAMLLKEVADEIKKQNDKHVETILDGIML